MMTKNAFAVAALGVGLALGGVSTVTASPATPPTDGVACGDEKKSTQPQPQPQPKPPSVWSLA